MLVVHAFFTDPELHLISYKMPSNSISSFLQGREVASGSSLIGDIVYLSRGLSISVGTCLIMTFKDNYLRAPPADPIPFLLNVLCIV